MSARNHRKKSYQSHWYVFIQHKFCDVSFDFVVFVACEVEKLCRGNNNYSTDLGNNPCLFRASAEVVVQSIPPNNVKIVEACTQCTARCRTKYPSASPTSCVVASWKGTNGVLATALLRQSGSSGSNSSKGKIWSTQKMDKHSWCNHLRLTVRPPIFNW